MGMKQSYFAFGDPLAWFERKLHPYRHRAGVTLNGHDTEVHWTQRAERAMDRLTQPLRVEMQIYFACVVKKRVLFHEADDLAFTPVNAHLAITFRPVEASSCDPVTFAKNHPERRDMPAPAAGRMHARRLFIDFRKGAWWGDFEI